MEVALKAISEHRCEDVMKILIQSPNLFEEEYNSYTIVSYAATSTLDMLKCVLNVAKRLRIPDFVLTMGDSSESRDPLMAAVEANKPQNVELLLRMYHFDLSNVNFDGQSALHIAVDNKRIDMVKMFLFNGANPNLADESGNSPLAYAIDNDSPDIVKVLLEYGANPNTVVFFGSKPELLYDIIRSDHPHLQPIIDKYTQTSRRHHKGFVKKQKRSSQMKQQRRHLISICQNMDPNATLEQRHHAFAKSHGVSDTNVTYRDFCQKAVYKSALMTRVN